MTDEFDTAIAWRVRYEKKKERVFMNYADAIESVPKGEQYQCTPLYDKQCKSGDNAAALDEEPKWFTDEDGDETFDYSRTISWYLKHHKTIRDALQSTDKMKEALQCIASYPGGNRYQTNLAKEALSERESA